MTIQHCFYYLGPKLTLINNEKQASRTVFDFNPGNCPSYSPYRLPNLKIDAISVSLLVLAIIPWLAPLLKSLELPRGLKVEVADLGKVKEQAVEAGLIDDKQSTAIESADATAQYSFIDVATTDPTLGLAGLRVEIEKSLQTIAKRYRLNTKHASINRLINVLANNCILSSSESNALLNMVKPLTKQYMEWNLTQ